MDLSEIFDGIGKKMLIDFEQIQLQINHMGERGGEREASLRTFLSNYLPSRYAVANGEIVDEFGNTSKQCDLVIYDHAKCPLLLAGEDYRVFPAEPVLAVIEVKSSLSSSVLFDAAENIKSVKNLIRKNGPIAGIVFAYSSEWKINPMISAAENFQKINQSLEPHQVIDLLCVLNSGVFYLSEEMASPQTPNKMSGRIMEICYELSTPVLLLFFLLLLDLLDRQESTSPDFGSYARMGDLGIIIYKGLLSD